MTFIGELKAILDRYGDGPISEEAAAQRFGEIQNCILNQGVYRLVELPPEYMDPLGRLFNLDAKFGTVDERRPMNLHKLKLAQLKLMSTSLKVRKGVTDPEVLADALEATSDAIGELAEYLDNLSPERPHERRRRR